MISSTGLSKLLWFAAGKLKPAVHTGAATILYLEQDQSARAAVTLALRRMGHTVVEASTMEEGLARAGHFGFHLFLLNVSLLDSWGPEFCLQARNLGRDIPVFFFSAEFGRIRRVDAPGHESFLHPPSIKALRHNIARLIGSTHNAARWDSAATSGL
jgi:DNA-binding response OmpR family regulator